MKHLSSSLIETVTTLLRAEGEPEVCFIDQQGRVRYPKRKVGSVGDATALRYALQESVDKGGTYVHEHEQGRQWVVALEHMRVVQGGMCSLPDANRTYEEVFRKGGEAYDCFYRESLWHPLLLVERRTEWQRRQQLAEADCEPSARAVMQSFHKERKLLAYIRAGDREGARRVLNDALSTIYLSVPQQTVLQARVIELLSGLTRAAIEDNPLLDSLILRNHLWVEQLVHAKSFVGLSRALMVALDEFIDVVHLHGSNRTNSHVHKALEYISGHYQDAISLQSVARHTGLSACRLAHLFREHTGSTVVEVIRQVRLRRAQDLLMQTGATCAEIAYATGFGDQSYFILHFKRQTGMTPIQYRRARHSASRH